MTVVSIDSCFWLGGGGGGGGREEVRGREEGCEIDFKGERKLSNHFLHTINSSFTIRSCLAVIYFYMNLYM